MKRTLTLYDNAILFLMYWVIFQDFLLPLVYKLTGSILIASALFYLKDIIMIALFAVALFSRRIEARLMIASMLYLFGFAVTFVITMFNQVPMMNALQSGRGMMLMPVFLCIGSAVSDKTEFRNTVIRRYFPVLLISAVFGIVDCLLDELVGTQEFWRTGIGLTRYLEEVKHQGPYMIMGLPGNFYGSYGNEFFSVKRLVGFWAGPLTAAYSLMLPILYYYINSHAAFKPRMPAKRIPDICMLLVLLVALFLTRTRAILLLGLMMIGIYSLIRYRDNLYITIIGVVGAVVALCVIDYDALWRFLYDGSTLGHILSIGEAVENIKLSVFGQGFASIGIYGAVGAENTYLSVLGNVGIWGFCLYVYIFARQILRCRVPANKADNFETAVFYTGIAMAITGMISEQLTAFTTIAPVYILLGAFGNGKARQHL